jgi:hypothetical protein
VPVPRRIRSAAASSWFDLLWFRLPWHVDDMGGGLYLGDRGWAAPLNRSGIKA